MEKMITFYVGSKIGNKVKCEFFKAGDILEKTNLELIVATVFYNNNVRGYTRFWATGLWDNLQEETLVIQVISDDLQTKLIGEELKKACMQDSVLVTEQELTVRFL